MLDDDEFYDKAQPLPGFPFPQVGDAVEALKPYITPAGHDAVVPTGCVGRVIELRMPGAMSRGECNGYIGCVVTWPNLKRYPAGIVIPWNVISNPESFQFQAANE